MRKPEISLIIPVFNQPSALVRSLELLKTKNFKEQFSAEIIIVDDGSRNGQEIKKNSLIHGCSYLRLEKNQGKGAALKMGFESAKGEYLIFTDSDFPYRYEDFKTIITKLKEQSEIVVGDRIHSPHNYRKMKLERAFFSKLFSYISGLIIGLKDIDTQCGLKGFRAAIGKDLFKNTITSRFAIDAEILYRARHAGIEIRKIPVEVRENGKTSIRLFVHGPQMLYDLVRIRFFTLKYFNIKKEYSESF